MICAGCKTEFDDNSRFCPKCGAAKPDVFSSGDKPFFVQTEEPGEKEIQSSGKPDGSGPPYMPGYRPSVQNTQNANNTKTAQTRSEQKHSYTAYRPSSLHTEERYRSSENTQGSARGQQWQDTQFNATPFKPVRTFDDNSIRRFLVGFTVVSVAVVVLVAVLVVVAGA